MVVATSSSNCCPRDLPLLFVTFTASAVATGNVGIRAIVVDAVEVVVVDVVVGAGVVVEVVGAGVVVEVVGAIVVVEVVVDGAVVVVVVVNTVGDVPVDSVWLVFTTGRLWVSLPTGDDAFIVGEVGAVSLRFRDGVCIASAFKSVKLTTAVKLLERRVVDGVVIVVFPISVVEVIVVATGAAGSSFSGLLSNFSEGPIAAPSILAGLGLGGFSYRQISKDSNIYKCKRID